MKKAKYRKIDPGIWNDEKFRKLSDFSQLLFFFLATHPHLTMIGAMRASEAGLAEEKGWPTRRFNKAFVELTRQGLIQNDREACLIWIPNFLKYNVPESPNVVKAWRSAFDLLPECALREQLKLFLAEFSQGLSESFQEAFSEAFHGDLAKPSTNQEQEQEQEHPPPSNSPQRGEQAIALDLCTIWSSEGSLIGTKKPTGLIKRAIGRKLKQGYDKKQLVQVVRNYARLAKTANAPGFGKWSLAHLLQDTKFFDNLLDDKWEGLPAPPRPDEGPNWG